MSKFTKWYGPKAKAAGFRPQVWTIGDLAKTLGSEFTVFTSFGHVNGVEGFGREAMRLDGEYMNVVTEDGHVVIRRPMDRKVRILVK